MDDIDFIKKCCEFAGGFTYIRDGYIRLPNGDRMSINCPCVEWEDVYFPLLLQRAIEGVNRARANIGDDYPKIETGAYGISVFFSLLENDDFGFDEYGCEDATKRSALEYVFQEMDK